MEKDFLDYLADFLYASLKFHNGFTKPMATIGYFYGNGSSILQKEFFKVLLAHGFKRTPFQLVFPGQTAGLAKQHESKIELHARFYNDGAIDCEMEVGRFHSLHYTGDRAHRLDLLEKILIESKISPEYKSQIAQLFNTKPYSDLCIRK